MKQIILLLSFISFKISAQQLEHKKINKSILTYSIVNTVNNTFGYEVYSNNKKIIQQNVIPCLNGNEGFKTKASAEKVAQLVVKKIEKGQMPPSVSIEEMQNLKAILK